MHFFKQNIGTIHMIGIGGIGMSGMALLLKDMGYCVQGSDMVENENVQRLVNEKIPVFIGHNKNNISYAHAIVLSSAVKDDNVEVQAARALGKPVIKRERLLAHMMAGHACIVVSGSHGKTTTVSLAAHALHGAGHCPTVLCGGIMRSCSSNVSLGRGRWMLVEGDESDGTFSTIPTDIGLLTNIDDEHTDHYGSYGALQQACTTFVKNIPFYGACFLSADCSVCRDILRNGHGHQCFLFGFSQGDFRIVESNTRYKVLLSPYAQQWLCKRYPHNDYTIPMHMDVPMPGRHNASNALGAVCLALACGISPCATPSFFHGFKGISRRLITISFHKDIHILDDYAHHPTEIKATLETVRMSLRGMLYTVVELHRFSRVSRHKDAFIEALRLGGRVFFMPLCSAGESPCPGAFPQDIAKHVPHSMYVETQEIAAEHLKKCVAPGDTVLFLGAGQSSQWAHRMPWFLFGRGH